MNNKKIHENDISTAISILRRAMADNPDYAHGFHCNVATCCNDAIESARGIKDNHIIANEAATRFMKSAFGVETSNDMLGKYND
jgi:hypothetical protein